MTAQPSAHGAAVGNRSVFRAWDAAELIRDGMSVDDVANLYGVAPATVRTRLSRAGFRSDGQQQGGTPIRGVVEQAPRVLVGEERDAAMRAAGLPVAPVTYEPPREPYRPPYTKAEIDAAARMPRCQSCKTAAVTKRGTLCASCQRLADDYEHTTSIPAEPEERPEPSVTSAGKTFPEKSHPDRVGGASAAEPGPSHTRPDQATESTTTETPTASAPDTQTPAGASALIGSAVADIEAEIASVEAFLSTLRTTRDTLRALCPASSFEVFDAAKRVSVDRRRRQPKPDRRKGNGGNNRVLDDADVARRYNAGQTREQIAAAYGVRRSAVQSALKRTGTAPLNRRLLDLDVDDLVNRYNAGQTVPQIAKALSCEASSVRKRLKARDDVAWRDDRHGHSGSQPKTSADDDPELVRLLSDMYEQGNTIADIAAQTAMGRKEVAGVLNRAGVKLRPAAHIPGAQHGEDRSKELRQRIADLGQTSKTIRAWAFAHGVDCPIQGTVPASVVDAWEQAQTALTNQQPEQERTA